ncbi:hypothetical protein HPB50_013326 [Hyalomma asiaticum]|uniref:Uncharacterized protein n=1 Tax=Hyalomma asiaticum TaxID=266040 RepID=A0ACB7THZ1_HYAAI|nr:hypothetical protein HPB50_013326 [Hyalomma asiaticum]
MGGTDDPTRCRSPPPKTTAKRRLRKESGMRARFSPQETRPTDSLDPRGSTNGSSEGVKGLDTACRQQIDPKFPTSAASITRKFFFPIHNIYDTGPRAFPRVDAPSLRISADLGGSKIRVTRERRFHSAPNLVTTKTSGVPEPATPHVAPLWESSCQGGERGSFRRSEALRILHMAFAAVIERGPGDPSRDTRMRPGSVGFGPRFLLVARGFPERAAKCPTTATTKERALMIDHYRSAAADARTPVARDSRAGPVARRHD